MQIEDAVSQSSHSVVFAAPADDLRARRPVDVVKLLASLGIGLVLRRPIAAATISTPVALGNPVPPGKWRRAR